MTRHPIRERDERELDIDDFTAGVKPPGEKSARLMAKATFERHIGEGRDVIQGKREPKRGADFVYLYAALHEAVYGAMPTELRRDVGKASALAANLLRNEFAGNVKLMLNFVRWTWSRESEQFRRRQADNTFRIGWRYQFGQRLLTDYRIAIGREGSISKGMKG